MDSLILLLFQLVLGLASGLVMSLVGASSEIVAFRTADGGQTWTEEVVPATIGTLYLTHDGQYLTVSSILEPEKVTVLRYTGE